MRTLLALVVLAFGTVPGFAQNNDDSLMMTLSKQSIQMENSQASEIDEKMLRLSDLLKSEAISSGIATEECKYTCTASCTWVNGVCQATTTCGITC